MKNLKKIGFGGGCHWCTEAVFQSLNGVVKVDQGWILSEAPNNTLSEAVVVHYDETRIPLKVLIEIHLLTHSSTNVHSMRKKYRSAIYYFNDSDKIEANTILNEIKAETKKAYVTQILPFVDFKLNIDSQLNYYQKNKQAPFCTTYIDPKLSNIKKVYAKQVKAGF